jgi:eukaryotic-like serine/threonine-protein kinase
MKSGSNWYEDPVQLTAEVKRSRAVRSSRLDIRGYDEVVEMARGGQGIVYRAVQRSTRRPVAIKVLLDGELASGVAQRRFEREIDLVASLRHPHIVSVYDSGTTEGGRLYLVMEFVEGTPLDQVWPSTAPVREALELIATVAEAVQYAHQRGVIHRDLKPSNIRVDGAKQPHILDFGLAKASGMNAAATMPGSNGATLSTTGQFMGSLPWASPEQAGGSPDAVDARTDVYALGVVLHQILTGRLPYDVSGGLKAALDNIIHTEPSRADRLRPEVGDEVGTIIAKSLSKEPERRYQSAGDLARDIRHYLAGEPIEAKRDSAWYTVRKTLKRYRLAAMAAAAFVLLLSAGLVVSIILAREARSQAARLGAVNEFVLGMLGAVDPDNDGPNTKIVDLLDRAATTVDQKYAGHDDLRDSLHETLRKMYDKLSHFPKARAEAELLVGLRKRTRGDKHPETLSAEADLASTMSRSGQAQEAIPILERVLAEQKRLHGPDDRRPLATLMTLAQCYRFVDRTKEAADLCSAALPGATAKYGAEDRTVIMLTGNLASANHDLGNLEEAERLYRDVIPRWEKAAGPEFSETIVANNNLGTLLILQNRHAEAETLFRKQLETLTRRLGPDNVDVLGLKSNFSKLLQDMNKMDEAEAMMLEALEGRIKTIGENHPHTMVTMNNVGSLYAKLKRYDDSERMHRKTLALRAAKFGEEHSNTVISMNNLAGTLREAGKLDEALALYEKAVSITDRTLPAGHYFNALFRSNLGLTLFRLKRYADAEPTLVEAHDALVKAFGPASPQSRQCAGTLADLYEATGRPELAAPLRAAPQAPPK